MTDKQIIIDENEINPNDWLEPYKPIPACEIKDCEHWVYAGNNVYGCRIAEDGLVCDDFNNDDECCMYRQLEYYKEALKRKEQECERLKHDNGYEVGALERTIDNLKAENDELKKIIDEAQNSKLDLKSFLVGEAIQNEYEEQLDQLKSDNKHLNNLLNQALKDYEKAMQTLTEIKEIGKKSMREGKMLSGGWLYQFIEQKISECEEQDGN